MNHRQLFMHFVALYAPLAIKDLRPVRRDGVYYISEKTAWQCVEEAGSYHARVSNEQVDPEYLAKSYLKVALYPEVVAP